MIRYLASQGGALLLVLVACEGPLPPENPKTQVSERAELIPIIEGNAAPSASGPVAPPPAVVFENLGLETPESVLYDPERDLYIVSNIHGAPDALDNDGFLSTLSPEGGVKELAWIRGGQDGVTLNAPKGSALYGGKLWVADVDHLRRFDVKTGKMEKAIAVPNATFLNDVSVAKDGTVYFTDSGVKSGKEGLTPTGVDAVYKLVGDTPTAVVRGTDLSQPNGLVADGDRLFFVTTSSNTLRELDLTGKELRRATLPSGGLDGVVRLGADDFLVSSWEQSAVFRGGFSTSFTVVASNERSPADIGFDSKRRRILVPHFLENAVHAIELDAVAPAASAPAASAPAASAAAAAPAPAPSASASPSAASARPAPSR